MPAEAGRSGHLSLLKRNITAPMAGAARAVARVVAGQPRAYQ